MDRTQQEILDRMEERKNVDVFCFERNDYLDYLDFEHARPFLKDGVTSEEWDEARRPELAPLDRIRGYMDFAWDKANDQRGLSANRSIMHCIAWLWLAGEDELLATVQAEYDDNYHYYGKPILEIICDHLGIDWKQLDDGRRTNG